MKKTLQMQGVKPRPDTEYLCLSSGHNELAERLTKYLLNKYGYKIGRCKYIYTFLMVNYFGININV